MARLVISAVGAAIGGFFGGGIGASIGWTIGSFIGAMLFPTPGPVIEGPRLSDLKVVTSAFGEPIADNWGTMRIAGHLVDSQNIKEHRVEQEVGGKGMSGGGTQVTYFYTVDAQFLICRAPVDGIRRIWADTKLIRNVSEDATLEELFASESKVKGGKFKFYLGAEDQLPNLVMEALHGVGEVPAYRGVVTAVTDNFKLANFANRIPNFQFEVFDDGQSQFGLLATSPPLVAVGELRASWTHVDDNGEIVVLYRDTDQISDFYHDDGYWVERVTLAGRVREEKLLDPEESNPFFQPVGGHADRPMYFGTGYRGAFVSTVYIFDYVNSLVYHLEVPAGMDALTATLIVVEDDDAYVIATITPVPTPRLLHFTLGNAFVKETTVVSTWNVKDLDGVGTQYLYALILDGNYLIKKIDKGSFAVVDTLDTGLASIANVHNISVASDDEIYFVSWTGPATPQKFWRVDNFSTITQIGEASPTDMNPSLQHEFIYKNGLFFWGAAGYVATNPTTIYVYGGGLAVQGIPLSIVVSEICQMVGLKTSQIDVAELVDIVDGYARGRPMTPRDLISQLQMRFFFDTVESDGKLKFRKRGRSPVLTIPKSELGAHEVGSDVPQSVITTQVQERELPARLEVNYLQRDKDYEQGNQYDERLITQSRNIVSVPLALSMSDNAAKQTAVVLLTESWLTRNQREISLTRKYIELEPTDVVTLQVD